MVLVGLVLFFSKKLINHSFRTLVVMRNLYKVGGEKQTPEFMGVTKHWLVLVFSK
jgi:hypothetical protein